MQLARVWGCCLSVGAAPVLYGRPRLLQTHHWHLYADMPCMWGCCLLGGGCSSALREAAPIHKHIVGITIALNTCYSKPQTDTTPSGRNMVHRSHFGSRMPGVISSMFVLRAQVWRHCREPVIRTKGKHETLRGKT